MKYAENLYRCKMLKKAALGRMCTMLKKLKASLGFLDEVRKHIARLPSINPFERTLLITGFPNVGKSSFINHITNANVDVQPYPFTTQSLYVGHTDYSYVIDTPGILDHTLEKRNTIEMQSITALAHLKCCVLYFLDLSETCGYTIENQISLFNNIKPLFANKPLLLVLSKSDIKNFSQLNSEDQTRITQLTKNENIDMVEMSNKSGEGISQVKQKACDVLLAFRIAQKPENLVGGSNVLKQEEEFLRGTYIAMPKKRDDKIREPTIPAEILLKKKQKKTKTLKDAQEELGGAGVFSFPLQEHYDLENPDWKYDLVPEILDGKNVQDFVDKDILQKLEELEREEEMLERLAEQQEENEIEEEPDPDDVEAFQEIKEKRALLRLQHKLKRNRTAHPKKLKLSELSKKLSKKGADIENLAQKSKKRKARLSRMEIEEENINKNNELVDENEENTMEIQRKMKRIKMSKSRSRSKGAAPREMSLNEKTYEKMRQKIQKQWKNIENVNESDRLIQTKKPKHLNTGKRSFKTNRR